MANFEFNSRFKNKLNTLGNTGFLLVDPSNAMNKQEVPEGKCITLVVFWPRRSQVLH